MPSSVSYIYKPFVEKNTNNKSLVQPNILQIKSSHSSPINYDFKKYEILRDRILDKIYEFIVILEDPRSSVNKSLNNITKKNENDDKKNIQIFISTLNNFADNLLVSDNTDAYEYFQYMKNFTQTIKKLSQKLEYYIYKTDSIDSFNIQEAIDTISRFTNDFKALDKEERKFPIEFRKQYVQKFQEKDFY